MKTAFPHFRQLDAMDCGPTCLRMIVQYYGKSYSLQFLRERSFISREGVSMLGISDAAEAIGFRTSGVRISLKQLTEDVPLPCILHWNQRHFVVCYKIQKKQDGYRFYISDPASQRVAYREEELKKCWLATKTDEVEQGTALALEPGPDFYNHDSEAEQKERSLSFFLRYLTPYKKELFQLILGMLVVSMLQLLLPFLTQALVDVGISNSNLNFITLVLAAQLIISVSMLSVEFIRSWILLHVNTRISIAMIAAEFEESESKYLQNLRSKENAQMSLLQTKIQLVQHEENLLDIRKQAYEEEHTYQTELKNAIEQLIAQLSTWKQSYLLKSPICGKATFMTVWSRNQNVKSGETVFVVQPADSSKVMEYKE